MQINIVPIGRLHHKQRITGDGTCHGHAVVEDSSRSQHVVRCFTILGSTEERQSVVGVGRLHGVVVNLDAIRVGKRQLSVHSSKRFRSQVAETAIVNHINVVVVESVDTTTSVGVGKVVDSQSPLRIRVAIAVVSVVVKNDTVSIGDLRVSRTGTSKHVDDVVRHILRNNKTVGMRGEGVIFRVRDGDTRVASIRSVTAVPNAVAKNQNLIGVGHTDTVPSHMMDVVIHNTDVLVSDVTERTDTVTVHGTVELVDNGRVIHTTNFETTELDVLGIPDLYTVHGVDVDGGTVSGEGSDEDVVSGSTRLFNL